MRSKTNNLWQIAAWLVVLIGIGAGAWFTRSQWQPLLSQTDDAHESHDSDVPPPTEERNTLELSKQARANLGLNSKPAKVQSYWRKIQIPGVIVDRPGVTDRGITSPIQGVVTQVHAFEGDIIRPGEKLFTLRLISDSLQQVQSELFKAIRETEIVKQEQQRVEKLIRSGVIPGKRMIELNQKVSRQDALIDAHQQDLGSRGLSLEQIDQIKAGNFLTTIDINAPSVSESESGMLPVGFTKGSDSALTSFFEIQHLHVDLGQQVGVGESLAILANHNSLYIKGHAFKKEASNLARAAENNWTVDVEFTEDSAKDWKPLEQEFQIRHMANTTDPHSRTFDFFVPLANQSRVYEKDDRPFVVWRFRPGQRVRIEVPVEEINDVIVVPAAAVFQKGPEAWVFQQNGDLFNRISVQILHQDHSNIVIANDGSISPGFYLAQSSAASLNRILKAQASSGGLPAGTHVHADGSVHGPH